MNKSEIKELIKIVEATEDAETLDMVSDKIEKDLNRDFNKTYSHHKQAGMNRRVKAQKHYEEEHE